MVTQLIAVLIVYLSDVFSAAGTDEGRKLWENTNTFSLEGVYHCVNKQGKKLLTYVHRQGWLHDNGYQQAWFGICPPLTYTADCCRSHIHCCCRRHIHCCCCRHIQSTSRLQA